MEESGQFRKGKKLLLEQNWWEKSTLEGVHCYVTELYLESHFVPAKKGESLNSIVHYQRADTARIDQLGDSQTWHPLFDGSRIFSCGQRIRSKNRRRPAFHT